MKVAASPRIYGAIPESRKEMTEVRCLMSDVVSLDDHT